MVSQLLPLTPVAKHFLSSRESFDQTARHWARLYAQPPAGRSAGGTKSSKASDAELAGLSEDSVAKFTAMGFERPKVISTLKSLNYRGNNITNINENTVRLASAVPAHARSSRRSLDSSAEW